MQSLQPRLKPLDLCFNDALGVFCLLPPALNIGSDRLLQIVDVINEDAVQLVHFRINITRNGDVDEEHRPIFPPAQKLFAMLSAEDGHGGSG